MSPAPVPPARAQSLWLLRWRRFIRHRAALASLCLLGLILVFVASAGPFQAFLGLDPDAADLLSRYDPPSRLHWLGTDEAGRDELLRLMIGGQLSLGVGLFATLAGGVLGLGIGLLAGTFGGPLDALLMRFTDGVIALPLLPLLIVLGALDPTKLGLSAEAAHSGWFGFWRIVVIIALVDWTSLARVTRAATLGLKDRDYMRSARVSGAGAFYLMRVHVLPNIATAVIVAVTLTIGRVILFESVLSFLGFGIVPPTPSWGNMLSNAQELVTTAPGLAVYPGLLIFLTVIAVNFIGDGLQHAFDPRSV